MKRLIIALTLILASMLALAQDSGKQCTFTTVAMPNGARMVCQTCCYQPSGQCFTTCR